MIFYIFNIYFPSAELVKLLPGGRNIFHFLPLHVNNKVTTTNNNNKTHTLSAEEEEEEDDEEE